MKQSMKRLLILLGAIFPFSALLLVFPSIYQKNYSLDSSYFQIIDNSNSESIDVYIGEQIGMPYSYNKLIDFLRNYNGTKLVNVILNTPGGIMMSGEQIINAIKAAKINGTKVVSVVDTFAMSLGAILALTTDTTEIRPNSLLMFHNVSAGGGSIVPPIQTNYISLVIMVSNGFLFDLEIDAILNGKAVWISGNEAIRRLCGLNRLAGSKEYVSVVCNASKKWSPEETIFEQQL